MLDIHSSPAVPEHNVQGLERISSLAGGVLMISKGLRHGGLLGMLQVAVGGLALARGVSGHCSTKAWWRRHRAEYHRLQRDIERGAAQLQALKASADAATRGVTVTGKDPLAGS
ncbi:YgaP-like transmembrane domain [Pseudomonas sp. UFMG81]|uniref:YgaP-like transmembrane domain n=1 Tax=Pseudomonas sp. UFMG81 TaxID=2745936 RepID=UPI00188F6FC3|nr:YgaP-like transmembrane domain [Pseudomonas sp. UFMG81]